MFETIPSNLKPNILPLLTILKSETIKLNVKFNKNKSDLSQMQILQDKKYIYFSIFYYVTTGYLESF